MPGVQFSIMFFTIAAKVNTDKHNFLKPGAYKALRFGTDAFKAARTQRAACIRNNAVSAELVAAFLNF